MAMECLVAPIYFIAFLVVVALVTRFVPGFDIGQEQDVGFKDVSGSAQLIMSFVGLVILPPIVEEIMARGLIYSSLRKAMPVLIAAILTSALFALPHMFESATGGLLYIAGLDTFILSMFLVYLREKTGALWASMLLHAIKNGVAFMALFIFKVQ